MALREYSGNARTTTLAGGITDAATSIAVADGTGYPTGTTGPFVITIGAGTAAEEKVLVATRAGNTLTVSSRGWDGTTASAHDNATAVMHTFSATDAREANQHVNDTTGDPHPQYRNTGPFIQTARQLADFDSPWTYPTAFSATPTVSATPTLHATAQVVTNITSVSTTSVTVQTLFISGGQAEVVTHFIAVGTA